MDIEIIKKHIDDVLKETNFKKLYEELLGHPLENTVAEHQQEIDFTLERIKEAI